MKGFSVFRTGWGWCSFVMGDSGVVGIILPMRDKESAVRLIEERWPGAASGGVVEREVREQLERYFSGEKVAFTFPLDFSRCSTFGIKVYKAAMTIPYGGVRSYGWVSGAIGSSGAARAVGRAMGCNPFPPVVPCHRVVKGDGTLGGFSAQMGLPLKVRMLEMEGVNVREGRIVGGVE